MVESDDKQKKMIIRSYRHDTEKSYRHRCEKYGTNMLVCNNKHPKHQTTTESQV